MSQHLDAMPSRAEVDALNSKCFKKSETTLSVTSLNDIPLNYAGRIEMSASISPSGSSQVLNCLCFGTDTERNIYASGSVSRTLFVNGKTGVQSTWGGWQELALNSKIPIIKHFSVNVSIGANTSSVISIGSNVPTGYIGLSASFVASVNTGYTLIIGNPYYRTSDNIWVMRVMNTSGEAITLQGEMYITCIKE